MNSRLVTIIAVAAALLVVALLSLSGEVAWLALPFLAYLGAGLLRAPAAESIHLRAARAVERVETPGDRYAQVRVTVTSQGSAALHHLCLADSVQPGMGSVDGPLRRWQALPPGGEASLCYRFRSRRGLFHWQTVQVVACDPLGLVETRLDLPAEAAVQITPQMTRFRSLPLRPQRTLHLSGSIPARLGGSGTDFWGIREYQPGDPLRRLDWHHAARHPGHRFTREFEQEEIAEIGLILDARQVTDLRVGDDSLFEHSVSAAASLADVFIREGNRVSLLVYGKPVIQLFPGYGKQQLDQIMNTLSRVKTDAGSSLGGLNYLPSRMFSSRSIVLIISPLVSGDWRLFPRLRAHGYQALLVSPDPVDFIRRTVPDDTASKLALRLSELERRLELQRISRLWVPVVNWKVGQPLPPLVRGALNYSHLQHRR